MKAILILVLGGFTHLISHSSCAFESGSGWVKHELDLTKKREFNVSVRQIVYQNGCNSTYGLRLTFFEPSINIDYAYYSPKLSMQELSMYCYARENEAWGFVDVFNRKYILSLSNVYRLKIPEKIRKAAILVPEGLEVFLD